MTSLASESPGECGHAARKVRRGGDPCGQKARTPQTPRLASAFVLLAAAGCASAPPANTPAARQIQQRLDNIGNTANVYYQHEAGALNRLDLTFTVARQKVEQDVRNLDRDLNEAQRLFYREFDRFQEHEAIYREQGTKFLFGDPAMMERAAIILLL